MKSKWKGVKKMKPNRKFFLFELCLILWVGSLAGLAATVDVSIQGFAFSPASVPINVGDTVKWTQHDSSVQHTTTSDTGIWDSGPLSQGQTFSHTFTAVGSYPYHCTPHPFMTGEVIVQAVSNAAPSVVITSPTNGASFPQGTVLTIQASASDTDGTVTQVQFFDGTNSLGIATASPYAITAALTAGSHTLTAVATDNLGATSPSAAVTVSIDAVPIPDPIPEHIAKSDITIEVQTVLDGLSCPLGMVMPDDGSGRMFIYDQTGVIWVVTNASVILPTSLLDVRSRLVPLGAYDERGLVGLATHPNFAQHPLIYTFTSEPNAGMADFMSILPPGKTNNHQSVLAEWRMDSAKPNQVDPTSRREVLRIDKPQSNHNGGAIHFGPDGFLYIALGDGGNANDVGDGHVAGGNAQNLNLILGKLLRIDADGTNSINGQYGVPVDNPFVGKGGLGEIYAYGLRNPWSYSFDRLTGQIYLGDVGQNKIEEVDLIVKGGNYGWNVKEGTFWFDSSSGNVVTTPVRSVPAGLIDPIAEYDHDEGTVVVGGFMYRGTQLTALQGRYVFGDWGTFSTPSGKLFYLTESNTIQQLRIGLEDRPLGLWIRGFGQDADGELYVFGSRILGPGGQTGKMLKVVPPPTPLMITTAANEGGTVFATYTDGGSGPFALQKKSTLSDTTWLNAAFTTNHDVDVPLTGDAGFFRVVDLAHQPPIPLTVYLSGGLERPNPVTTSGAGSGTFSLEGNTLAFNIEYSGLSSEATAAHIHGAATAATSAGVVISLVPFSGGPLNKQGIFSCVVLLTGEQKAMILSGQTYVNVHTVNHPAGEIRGQIAPVLMQIALNGANEVPNPVTTDGTGLGTLALVGNQLTFNLGYQGLSSAATAAHIHGPATAAQTAGVLVDLAPFNGGALGIEGRFSGTITLTPDQLASVIDGLTYVNIHTSTHPGGEMRGQIVPQAAGVPLSVAMSGAAEKPNAVTTSGEGNGLFSLEGNTLLFNITYTNLSGVATAVHFHGPASTAQSTSVLVSLEPFSVGALGTSGTLAGSVGLTSIQRDWVLSGQTYVNLHTENNPAGEIRGQITPVLMVASLSGTQERPNPVVTGGTGLGTFTLVGNQLGFNITYRGLTATAIQSHIHGPATAFAVGGVLIDLGSFNSSGWGTYGGLEGLVTLNATNLASVIDSQTYVNVHSITFSGGEIRGPITR
jgi:glucose/arabinose dehydrogenase/plastocyanin